MLNGRGKKSKTTAGGIMRSLCVCIGLLAISQSALAFRVVDSNRANHKIVICDGGARTELYNDGQLRRRAASFCNAADQQQRPPQRSAPRQGTKASSSPASARCSATSLPIESELDVGKRLGTISVSAARPVTGTYMDVVCVQGEHRGKIEQFQYRCLKNGEWGFVQRLWTRNRCREDGRITLR
jgi:hypothetical protein